MIKPATSSQCAHDQALHKLRGLGDTFRTKEAQQAGIHTRVLYSLKDRGVLEQLSRGVYRFGDKQTSEPDLVIVGSRVPQGVICLVSALSFHNITTQVPHTVSIALPKGGKTPQLHFPPLSVYRFSGLSLTEGVEKHIIDGTPVKVYCPEKTLADCFKFRNKIGMNIVLEALKFYLSRKKPNLNELLRQAKNCRVDKIMYPYLEISC